ncbi:hypothetical protein [Acinetobacter haemolyticus]|uniref:hypothetical protein n=1 Tax=Acinetobacter haemolyticus TaxID=29430 RepID=UPI00325B7419
MSKKLLTAAIVGSMVAYIGTKSVLATPMTRGEYNEYQGWQIPENEDPTEQGYLVEYKEGGKPNHPNHAGYISWSPKDIFDYSYHPQDVKNSMWGTEIHKDHNGVTVTHNERIETQEGEHQLDHGHFYDVLADGYITVVQFQQGPVKENGVNGITNEALLAILIHRTKIIDGNFPCDENKTAITYMENALALFNQRTKSRQERGVEGFNIA